LDNWKSGPLPKIQRVIVREVPSSETRRALIEHGKRRCLFGPAFRPGSKRLAEGGEAICVEVWAVPEEYFGSFVAGIPTLLGIGKLELADGFPGLFASPMDSTVPQISAN
jgi:hypothetical protein